MSRSGPHAGRGRVIFLSTRVVVGQAVAATGAGLDPRQRPAAAGDAPFQPCLPALRLRLGGPGQDWGSQ